MELVSHCANRMYPRFVDWPTVRLFMYGSTARYHNVGNTRYSEIDVAGRTAYDAIDVPAIKENTLREREGR